MPVPLVNPSGELEGPWDQAFYVLVPTPLRSKSNFRRYGNARPKSAAQDWERYKAFEDNLSVLLRAGLPRSWDVGSADAPLSARPSVVAFVYAVTALDAANLSKSVLDAAQGTPRQPLQRKVYHNDASVRATSALGVRVAATSTDQWGLVAFARLAPGASSSQLLEALDALSTQALAVAEPPAA